MSKLSTEKIVKNIESLDERIARIRAQKAKAQERIDSADQEIRETQARRVGLVALLEARGETAPEAPAEDAAAEESTEAPEFA